MSAPPTTRPGPIASPLALALTYLGTSERSSVGRELVRAWFAEAGLPGAEPESDAWCGAFAYAICRRFPGLPTPALPLRARAWLTVGQPIPPEYLHRALPGWIVVVLSRGRGVQPGPEVLEAPGHVGFYSGLRDDGRVLLVGGNQVDAVTESPYLAERVLGYRSLL